MASLVETVDRFDSIGGISMKKYLRATPSDSSVEAAFRTFEITVSSKGWSAVKAEVESNTQSVFDDCEAMIFNGLPLEDSEPNTTRQVFIASISAVLITTKGKDGVAKSLNNLLVEIHKSTRDLKGLPSSEGRLDFVIGQLFRHIITVIGYAQPKPSPRLSLYSPLEYDVVKRTEVQEELHHIRWLVDDLQWGLGDFAVVFTQQLPPPSSSDTHVWPRTEFLRKTMDRIQELHGLPHGESEEKRFQAALRYLVEVLDGLAVRLCRFEERVLRYTYDEVDRLLQATKATKSSFEMASNVLAEVSRCLSRFSHIPNTEENKIALARSVVVTLGILQILPDAIRNHATHLTVVSAISKISVLNIEEKLSLNHEGIARLVGDLRSLTVSLGGGEKVTGQAFTSMWEEALKVYKSLTSTDLGALANASGAETIEDLQKAVDQNYYALIRGRARCAEARQALQPVLGFLHSFTGAIGEAGAFGAFFPSKVIAGSVKAVLDASQDIRNSNDMVFDLFKDLSAFLVRVKIHTRNQEDVIPELKLACTEILCQFLIVMGTAYSVVKRGRLIRIINYLAKSPDSIAAQVRKFERICYNLDGMLLSLIFEATYTLGGQRLAPASDSAPAEACPTISTTLSSFRARDDPLVMPLTSERSTRPLFNSILADETVVTPLTRHNSGPHLQMADGHEGVGQTARPFTPWSTSPAALLAFFFQGSCLTPVMAFSILVLAVGLTISVSQHSHTSFTSNQNCR